MQNICDPYNIETNENNKDHISKESDYSSNIEIKCHVYNSNHKSELNNTQNNEKVLCEECNTTEDCRNNEPSYPVEEAKYASFRRKGDKYFPQFKTKVVSYALKNSIKKAASDFKVNKGTISSWIHEFQIKKKTRDSGSVELRYDYQGPDVQFIKWLKNSHGNNILSKQDVVDKVRNILHSFEKQDMSKTSSWFSLYAKRMTNENCVDKIKIKYPLEFKKEVVSFTKYMSKKLTSKVFNIDRKRICEWVSDVSDGNVKERDVSKYVTDPKVDKMIWDWYCHQQNKPSSKEIRLKAAIFYKEAGYSDITCSPGWYYRWRMRYSLPTIRGSQALRDSKLLTWALIQIEENKSIFHSDLLKQASLLKEANFKASSSWVFRFVKKYMSHYNPGVIDIPLPDNLINETDNFRKNVLASITKNKVKIENIVAFDEIPLNFSSSEFGKQSNLIGKSEWENCQASIIVSCLPTGNLLQTTLILKNPVETSVYCPDIQPILVQEDGINDSITIEKWISRTLKFLNLPAMIIGDIYEPHVYIKSSYSEVFAKQNVDFAIIPGGCTSQLQPLFFGVTQKFKAEIQKQWIEWCRDISVPENIKLKHPENNNIAEWVQNAHVTISNNYKDLIKDSFIKAGIIKNI